MDYLLAFVCGGAICIIGQLLLDIFKLTPAHVMTSFVVIGAILDGFGIYDKFIEFAGGGCHRSDRQLRSQSSARRHASGAYTRIYRNRHGDF